MKFFKFKIFQHLISLILVTNINAFYDGQPKIISKGGNLIIESAKDKNITLRVVGKGRILANNIDLLTNQVVSPSGETWNYNPNRESTQFIQDENQIKRILNIVLTNITRLDNVTIMQSLTTRRLQIRINKVQRDFMNLMSILRLNKCEQGPCKNGGTCIPLYNSFSCQCTNAWQGSTCETDVDECSIFLKTPNLGCQNGAWCDNTPGSYNCHCKGGFFGTHCTEKEQDCLKASARELCDHGFCLNTKTGFECICEQGWKKHESTGACTVDINECDVTVNPCHSTCINVPGTFYCGPCSAGFTGNGFVCKDIDECQINNGGCSPRVSCINTIGSYQCGPCPPGYSGDGKNCEISDSTSCKISDRRFCSPFADCRMISGFPKCTCKAGFVGDGHYCQGVTNPCIPNPCALNERCESSSTSSGFRCLINSPCFTNPCHNGGSCVVKGLTSFECRCAPGFGGRICTVSENSICNKILTDNTGTLDMMNYTPNSNCYFVIQTTETKILNITITQFNLKNTTDCTRNFFQINNGKNTAAPSLGRFCGIKFPMNGQFYTTSNYLYIWFKTDSTASNSSLGFQLTWTSIDPICGGQLSFENNLNSAGIISSPGWPAMSPHKRDCSWNFLAPHGKQLAFRILEVKLGGTEAECSDYLEIRSGDVKKKICSSSANPSLFETGSNIAEINFHSDEYGTDSSFQLHYEIKDGLENCGGIFEKNNGIIKSPSTDKPTLKPISCQYLIRQPSGARVMVEFDIFELPGIFNCTTASLEVYDGSNANAPLLFRECNSEIPDPIKSSGNNLMLRYTFIDGFPHSLYNRFKARYKLICDLSYKNETGTITSLGFPKPYTDGFDCVYEIQAPINHVISLSTEIFSLSNKKSIECDIEMDNVEIFTSLQNSQRYCQNPENIILSKTNYMKIVFHSVNNFERTEGFKFNYQFENIGCGGIVTNSSGTISTLNSRMTNNFCEWIIKAPQDNNIALRFKEIKFNNIITSNCSNSLVLFENFTKGETIKTEVCNIANAKDVISSAGIITLIQKLSKPLDYDEGFRIEYEVSNTVCGGTIDAAYGEIKSPGYPNEYPNNLDCSWLIIASEGHQIELKPQNFSLELISDTCSEDYLEIRNGKTEKSTLMGRYCGTNIPSFITSHSNHLLLTFHSDYSIRMPGFLLTYQQTATGCGGNIDSFEGSIHSPHYPDITRNGALCNWLITVSAGSTITATLEIFVDNPDDCDKNQLFIFDGDSVAHKNLPVNCKDARVSDEKTITQTIYSSSNKLFVRFETTSADEGIFLLTYKTNCTVTLTELQGQIESPNFPNDYPNNLLCEWVILSKKSKSITLVISHLQLEGTVSDCFYDHLTVTELRNNNSLATHSLCREKTKTITSEGDSIKIEFSTDYSNSERGFRIEYQIETCSGYFKSRSGSFQSLNVPYSNNMHCIWTIETDYGNVIQLNVKQNIGLENCDWINEGLLISNDKDGKDIIIKVCQDDNFKVASNGRFMYITFSTNEFHKQKFFKAYYTVLKKACGGQLRVGSTEIQIKSPNFPQNYPSDTDCEWSLDSPLHRLQIELQYADIEQSDNCQKDYLELYNSSQVMTKNSLLKHCGSELPLIRKYNSSGNDFSIKFHSDNTTEKTGFDLSVNMLCGGNIYPAEFGFISKKPNQNNCIWNLKAPDLVHINIIFTNVICTCGDLDEATCENTYGIQIYEDRVLRASFCKHPPHALTSTGDSFNIYAKDGVKSMNVQYSSLPKMCEAKLNSIRGNFASPQYPNIYEAGYECETIIRASRGNMIQLTFVEFELIKSDHCNDDYVEIRETGPDGKLMNVLCGKDIVNNTYEFYEKAWIKFHSAKDSVGAKGFLAHFEYKKKVEILTESKGITGFITHPPLGNIFEDPDPYNWRIITDIDKRIVFNFKEYSQGLKFYDGFDETAEEIEIQHSPFTITSTSSFAYIISENAKLHDFKIEWKIMHKFDVPENKTTCGEIIEISHSKDRNFSSPNYPKPYPQNSHCEWIFRPKEQTRRIEVSVYAADLEGLTSCYADYLKIYSGEDLAIWTEENVFCNLTYRTKPFVIYGTPYIKMVFHSDSYSEGPGFTTMISTKCGGLLTESAGVIDGSIVGTLVGKCTWKIKVRRGRTIKFEFDFNIDNFPSENSDGCENAYTLLRDGIDEDAPIIASRRICSQTQIEKVDLITKSNVGYVHFEICKPYKSITWKLTYQEQNQCGDEIHLNKVLNSTELKSPNYPLVAHPYAECTWTITSPPATTINLEFTEFVTLAKVNCFSEYIQIRDGSTNLAPDLGRYCRKTNVNRITYSTGNVLWIKYFANTSEPMSTFIAKVSIANCFTLVSGFYSGEIKSLNYPAKGAYKPNSECIYALKTSVNYGINITISELHLPFNESNLNRSDHLEINVNDGTTSNVIFLYGNETRKFLEIYGDVKIKFVTYNAQTQYRGFKLIYKRFSSCYKSIHGEEGEIIARKHKRKFFMCRFEITVPKGRIVRAKIVEIELLDLEGRAIKHKVRFFNDFKAKSKITEISNTTAILDFVNSTDNKMLIQLEGNRVASIKIKFDSYGTSECFGDFNLEINEKRNYFINSDRFPSQYYCSSNIIMSNLETIGFRIENLLMMGSNGFGAPILFKFMYTNYKSLMENLTNYDVAISRKGASLEINNSGEYKIFSFKISLKKHQCGSTEYNLMNLENKIELPVNLSSNYGRIDCVWNIDLNFQYSAQNFTFATNFSINDCAKEYLAIYNGNSPSDVQVKKLCGNDKFGFVPDNKYVVVHYHAENYSLNSKVNISRIRKKQCGGEIISSFRGAKLNFGKEDYENNLECVWNYNGKDGFSNTLQFYERFFVPSNPNCTEDYIEIKQLSANNKWITYPRFCGRELPKIINSTDSRFQIKFRSDNKTVGDGFSIKFGEYCGGIYDVTENVQTINSPPNWHTTRYRIRCNYTLITDTNNFIIVKFNKFKVGSTTSIRTDCIFSKMSVYYEKDYATRKIGEYCQKNAPTEIRSQKFISLVYDSQLYSDEYSFEFYVENCGGNITEPKKIHSPRDEEDGKYPTQMDCRWNIKAPVDKDIAIRFNYLVYEKNHNCNDDYVAIYNSTEDKPEFRKTLICGNHTGYTIPVVKTSNNAVIITKSDDYGSSEGFSAEIYFVPKCDKFLNLTVNKISHIEFDYYHANGQYENNLDCQISFTTDPGFQISIEFNDFDVKNCSIPLINSNSTEKCQCDYLEIFDSSNVYRESLGKFCGNNSPKIIQSTKQDLTMRFVSDRSIGGIGFKYEVQRKLNPCNVQTINLIKNKQHILASPDYPEYPPNIFCEWIINATESFIIQFEKFDLEDPSPETGKCNDYLEIIRPFQLTYTDADHDLVYCSNKIPTKLQVFTYSYSTEKPKIIFKSNSAIQKSGFKLLLKDTGICDLVHDEPSGLLEQEGINSTCRFTVKTQEHKTLSLFFTIRVISVIQRNCTHYVKIFDTESNALLKHICFKDTYATTYPIFLKTNKAIIQLDTTNSEKKFDMDLFYMGNTMGQGCGGDIHAVKGLITSPMYPDNFRNYTECHWTINVPVKSIIDFHFPDLDMGSKKNCANNYIQFIDIFPTHTKVAQQLCGGDFPSYYSSKSYKMEIVYKRTVNFDGRGWVLNFEAKAPSNEGTIIF